MLYIDRMAVFSLLLSDFADAIVTVVGIMFIVVVVGAVIATTNDNSFF